MKKALAIMFVALMLVSLTACGTRNEPNYNLDRGELTVPTPVPTAAPTPEPTPVPTPIPRIPFTGTIEDDVFDTELFSMNVPEKTRYNPSTWQLYKDKRLKETSHDLYVVSRDHSIVANGINMEEIEAFVRSKLSYPPRELTILQSEELHGADGSEGIRMLCQVIYHSDTFYSVFYVGVKGEKVKLHRLDGRRWNREKSDAQKAVADLAAALLETQAKRAVVPGFAYDVEAEGMAEFEAAFPYEETPDQARAIADVKRDLASQKPMDRLICGDAGYGKTEVAMRAAFIAAMNGKQTALLAPTTVLAQQHYETFLARFEGTPIRIEAMSRFQTDDEKKGARLRLANGAADIVIGTHALLSAKVHFHDLGLIVVDEEQRFGVRHKEYLKRLRATADVLTMSATPIPRTLYLSMTGARDLSVLRTPPRERVATETKIVRDTDATVKSAISRELARGGQVYFLHNRVITISRAEKRLRALCPDAKIDVAHGQMPTTMLAEKMRRFAEGRTDVLICTTIVESGLDITRANTILVDRADCFGIAELYQLRGRVGRGSRQGYAYFLLPAEGLVDSDARERLEALRKHSGQGSGYNLSLRDLEIRGAGNLLGSEQSGHIAAVGFSLYCQLLQRTIAKMKGEAVPDLVEVSVNLDFIDFSPGTADPDAGASLPYDYVEEEAQRMDFHRRLAEAVTVKDVQRLRRELADRYGRLPPAATRLVRLAEFRVRCAAKRVARLDVKGTRAVFYLQGSRDPSFVERVQGNTADRKISSLFKMLEGDW